MTIKIGDTVVLIWREYGHNPDWPPMGAFGVVVRGLDEWGDWEVDFPEWPWCGVRNIEDRTWEVPNGWIVPLADPDAVSERVTERTA